MVFPDEDYDTYSDDCTKDGEGNDATSTKKFDCLYRNFSPDCTMDSEGNAAVQDDVYAC